MGALKRELLRKRKDKYKRKAEAKWYPIVEKYDLKIGSDIVGYASDQYGWAKAEGGFLGFIANLFTKPLNIILIAVGGVAGFAFVGTTIFTQSVLILSIASYIVGTYYAQKIYLMSMSAYSNSAGVYALQSNKQAQSDRARASEAVTRDIVYGGYAIYANGEIYKNQSAGVNSNFSSQIALDTSKGIYGTAENSFIDDKINNRSQTELGGNVSFVSSVLKTDFPLAKSFDESDNYKLTKEMYMARSLKSIEGFNALVKAEFGLNCYSGFLDNTWKTIEKRTIDPFKVKLCEDDFLVKNKAYNKGEMRDFDVTLKSDFKESKTDNKNQTITKPEVNTLYDKYNTLQNNNDSLEKKADNYVDCIEMLFANIINASFYDISEIKLDEFESEKDKTEFLKTLNINNVYKAFGTIGVKNELVSVDNVKIIFEAAREYLTEFEMLENYVLSFVKQYNGFRCSKIDLNNNILYFDTEVNGLRLSEFSKYKHFVILGENDLKILLQFQNGVPKNSGLTYELLAKYYDGV